MRMSTGALDLMNWLTDQYIAKGDGRYKTWAFTPQAGDPRAVELLDLGLIKPRGSREGMHFLTDRGHQWVMDNRKLEGQVDFQSDEETFFPDTFVIGETEYKGQRMIDEGKVLIPCTGEPLFRMGDVIHQKSGRGPVELRVIDSQFRKGGSLDISRHPDMLTLHVENATAAQYKSQQGGAINIGSVSGQVVSVGSGNAQTVNITLQELVQQVAKSGDADAKSLLAKFFSNPTVSSILGAGSAALIKILGGV
jgi:hypothetical protein